MKAAFFAAEDYHQDYATKHPTQPYIAINDLPKVANLKTAFRRCGATRRCWSRRRPRGIKLSLGLMVRSVAKQRVSNHGGRLNPSRRAQERPPQDEAE